MNHSNKLKNFNRTTSHRKAMFANMVESFNKNGFLTTTLPKAKYLQRLLAKGDNVVKLVRVGFRKGDNAEMAKLVSAGYLERLNKPAKKSTKNSKK